MTWWQLWRSAAAPIIDPNPDVEAELAQPFEGPAHIHTIRGRLDVYRQFGNPGVGKVDPKWERESMVVARNLPGRWNGGKGKLYVHRLAEPYLREALRRCQLIRRWTGATEEWSCLNYITRLGCFNFRHQRHDPSRPLSYHSWGIAVDINSEDNAGKYLKAPPAPFSPEWRKLWPRGVPEELVRAFESVGWKWGGRWKGYVDNMHFCLVNG